MSLPRVGEPPCLSCRALCCRGFKTVPVYPERYPQDAAFVEAGYAERRGPLWVIPREGQRCAYLDDATSLCLVHSERPHACRDYDCRVPWSARNLIAMLEQEGLDGYDAPTWPVILDAARQ